MFQDEYFTVKTNEINFYCFMFYWLYIYFYIFTTKQLIYKRSFYLSIFLSFYLPIFLSFYLSIFLTFYLSIFLSFQILTDSCAVRDRQIVSIERVYTPSTFYMKLAVFEENLNIKVRAVSKHYVSLLPIPLEKSTLSINLSNYDPLSTQGSHPKKTHIHSGNISQGGGDPCPLRKCKFLWGKN